MSWYPIAATSVPERKYLSAIQRVFQVQDTRRKWIPYKLQPHQIEWHRDDIAIQGANAKNRIVGKSRNTSFTTSALISNLTSIGRYENQILPFVRLNQKRANDLIGDCKALVGHMTPIKLPDGRYWPFNPHCVNIDNAGSIFFEDRGIEFRAFPATASASEIIRGLRIAGSAGIVDESNYMRDFENIYIALRDAEAGSDEHGKREMQLNIGTTFKGNTTAFKLWYDKQRKKNIRSNVIYKWPVFDPLVFDPELPILDQPDLIPIVSWHSLTSLHDKFEESKYRALEEFMCVVVDAEDQLYPQQLIQKHSTVSNPWEFNEEIYDKAYAKFKRQKDRRPVELEDYKEVVENYVSLGGKRVAPGIYFMGVDPAYTNDFFGISIFNKTEESYYQKMLFWKQKCDPDDMEDICKFFTIMFLPAKCRIDAKGIGFHIGANLKKMFGTMVEPIRAKNVKGLIKNETLALGEYMHTNHVWMLNNNQVQLIEDEMQYIHYGVWNDKYQAPSTAEYGHGDIVIANCLALLPINWKVRKGTQNLTSNMESTPEVTEEEASKIVREFNRSSLANKINHYKNMRQRR